MRYAHDFDVYHSKSGFHDIPRRCLSSDWGCRVDREVAVLGVNRSLKKEPKMGSPRLKSWGIPKEEEMELQDMKQRKAHEVRRDEVEAELARRLASNDSVGVTTESARELSILNRA